MSAKYWKEILKALGGVDFTMYALPTITVYRQLSKMAMLKKAVNLSKNYFFSIIILHAHLQYVWNMSAKYWKEILKVLGEVDFTKYALPTIIVYKQWSKNGSMLKIAVNVKNYFFSIIILHAHLQYVWNMSAKYWKEILKALGGVDFTNYALPKTSFCGGYNQPVQS